MKIPTEDPPIPRSIEEAVNWLDENLSHGDRHHLLTNYDCAETCAVDLHTTLGRQIRNSWLWNESRLAQYLFKLGFKHPDDMSSIIIECLWNELHKKPWNIQDKIDESIEYWKGANL